MTEFKKGDKVTELTITDNPKMLHETLCVAQTILGRHADGVRTGEHVARIQRLINETERHRPLGPDGEHGDRHTDTCGCDDVPPAPLDPAKVAVTLKGGDYIEAESDGAKIGGKVSHVTERGLVAIEHLGEFAIHHITASPTPDGYRMFVLTAHQPAPEPEPYTPTPERVRQAYVDARGDADLITESEAGAEFDRWLDSLGLNR
jgi:hypothetical protein